MSQPSFSPPAGVPVADIDFTSWQMCNDPYPVLREIRELGPLVWNKRGHWMTAHDKVCREILNRPGPLGQEGAMANFFGAEAFISIDEVARHNALRSVWMTAFRRDVLTALACVIRTYAEDMLETVGVRFRAGESPDLVPGFCRPLPAYVISFMMGIPDDMMQTVVEWSDLMANSASGGFPIDYDNDPAWLAGERAKKKLGAYLYEQIDYRRSHRGEDLISQIVHSEVGRTLSDEAMMVNTRQLLFAGNETTANWLAHIVVVLGRHPEVRRQIIADPSLTAQALDEIMRWEPVVHTLPRGVRGDDVVIAGQKLENGVEVVMLFGGANRDPERYEDPERFNIHRERNANLGFGYGLHSCLGVTLARIEALEATKAFLAHFPEYELTAPAPSFATFPMRGPGPIHIVPGGK
jgi:cytochrome P450